jgi:predicted ATPase
MPKLSFTESLIFTLKEEPLISKVLKGFKQIIFSESNSSVDNLLSINQLYNKYDSAEKVISSDLAIIVKLTLIYQNDRNLFNQIKETFCDIFPNIEDIKIEPLNIEHLVFKELPLLQIKEYSVDYWIPFDEISSGMLRTLTLVAQMFLSPTESVIVIDEFENSLGVNCINILTNEIIQNKNKAQFILTSHHPYIINTVSIDSWKLVTRQNSTVRAIDVKNLPSWPKSNHEAFIKLVNLPEFEDGIVNE